MDVFGRLISMIEVVGFAPLTPLQQTKPTYTLHSVVRDLLGMARRETKSNKQNSKSKLQSEPEVHITSDDADVSFWNFLELREYISMIYSLIDEELSHLVGRPTNALAWEHDPLRKQEDIIQLLSALRVKHPNLDTPPIATARPIAKDMVAKGKIEAAIANTIAVLAANDLNYGDLLEQIASDENSNEEILISLDAKIERKNIDRNRVDKKSLLPRTLVQSYIHFRSNADLSGDRSPTIAKFLNTCHVSNNFAGNSEDVIISRLKSTLISTH